MTTDSQPLKTFISIPSEPIFNRRNSQDKFKHTSTQ
uniref:Uncharacterized protein n=1 Tax=Anguilla anguilla TaxID=7936 RepID=A0A0E9VQ61_ANGAN